ncbi:MAG TPA: hypothetical protein VIV07_01240 [Sphingomicrobium sp.]
MNKVRVLAAGVSAAVLIGAAPVKSGAGAPPPVANYWMDVSTVSGFGAGMMGGGRPSMSQIMGMMNGGGGAVAHMLSLKLSSREKPAGAPQANHFIPAAMQMGASLPLVTPEIQHVTASSGPSEPGSYEKPRGRMLIYWGCGEHAAAPMVIDFAKVAAGQIPPGLQALAKMGRAMGRMAREPNAENSAGFGEWPNIRDSRQVPAAASLLGAHKVEANYAPPIAFSLGAGQDFMPGLGLHEAGALPSGAERLDWSPPAQATGYALALFGGGNGDTIIWTSGKSASFTPPFDYESPGEVRKLIASGAALPPGTSECVLPAEVARAVPQGMVMMIGYGPEAYFSDSPKAPKWTTRVRFKTTAMLMRGMGQMGGGDGDGGEAAADPQQPQPQQAPAKKRRGIGLGDLLGAVPH